MPGYRRVAAREPNELRSKSKTMETPAELSARDPRQVLKKRLCEEMEALHGILRRVELVVRKNAGKDRAAPRRGKDGRFLATEARSEVMEADHTPCAKRRKAMPPVEIIKPLPRISKADQIPCAKKSRTTPPMEMEIIEPRISQDEIFSVVTRLSSLSSNIPARIVEFLHKECTGHGDVKAGEIEVDLGSMTNSAMFELQKLLDEFAEEEKRQQHKEESMNVCRSISGSSPCELEEGEFIEEDYRATMDTCGGDTSVVARKGLCSPPRILEDGEMTEEEGVICGDSALATRETAKSPSNSSSSGSSSSSSSDGSSGSSCSDSSDSDSSESDSDDECATSNVAPAVLPIPKADASAIAMPVKNLCSPLRILEDGEMTEEEVVDICGDASPIKTQKFVESAKSPSNNSSSSSLSGSSSSASSSSGSSSSDSSDSDSSDSGSDDECVTSNTASAALPKSNTSPMAMPHKVLSPIAEEEFAETRNSRRSNSTLLEDGEIEEEQEPRSPMAAKKFAETVNVNSAGSTNGQCVRSSSAPAVHPEPSKPRPAAQGTARHLYAKNFEKKQERATTAQGTARQLYDKAFEKKRQLERQRAYKKLEEMERNAKAKPIFDWIHPRHLRQLGITTQVEYAVTSERRLSAGRGCPVQSLLGLFLKAE